MATSKKNAAQDDSEKKGHSVKIDPSLAEMLNIISARRKTPVKHLLDEWLRPIVVKSYGDVMRELNDLNK